MAMTGTKIVQIYAVVCFDLDEYRVWPNGNVARWVCDDLNVEGYWQNVFVDDNHYEEIKAFGLEIINGN